MDGRMSKPASAETAKAKAVAATFDLPKELVEQYKSALGGLSDVRLLLLLLFNSFEEVMKSFAAWRLGCSVDQLPRRVTNAPSLLFDLVLVDNGDLRKRCDELSNVRNTVAHKFHTKEYEAKLNAFIEEFIEGEVPTDATRFRDALINSVFGLALDVATHFIDFPARGEYPFPFLSIELATHK